MAEPAQTFGAASVESLKSTCELFFFLYCKSGQSDQIMTVKVWSPNIEIHLWFAVAGMEYWPKLADPVDYLRDPNGLWTLMACLYQLCPHQRTFLSWYR